MSFPLTQPMTTEAFRDEIILHYWKDLTDAMAKSPFKCPKKDQLPDDYAKIGSFLSNKDLVEAALLPLEDEIRQAIGRRSLAFNKSYQDVVAYTVQRNVAGGSLAHLKSHTLLTNALRASEAIAGFNHEKIQKGTFFDEAVSPTGKLHGTAATSDKLGNLTGVGKDDKGPLSKPVSLARGAPTVIGDLDPVAFNVLLRHGYQFKDVAAGPYHGEYTHRLQWYAILKGNLGLANSPLDIFRSLGYSFAKADKNVPTDGSAQLWMWQALFDTAETEPDARRLRTVAYTTKGSIYTCPENMNKALMKLETTDTQDNNPLWCLRVLLKTRWKKRFDEALVPLAGAKAVGMEKLHEKMAADRTSMVLSSSQKQAEVTVVTEVPIDKGPLKGKINPKTQGPFMKKVEVTKLETIPTMTLQSAGYALAWYLRDDSLL